MSNVSTATKNSPRAWAICMVAALYFFYIFIQMTKFNAIGHDLMVDFKIDTAGLGALSSMYFWGNLIFLFPAGLMLDRFSAKRILIVAMSITIVCTFLFSIASGMATSSWCFLFIGLAGAFGLLLPLRLISRWLPEKMALASGLTVTIGFLGAMISQAPLTSLVDAIGWRHAMQINALLGVGLLILFIVVIRDYPAGVSREMSQAEATSIAGLWRSLKAAITNRQNWAFGLYTCLINLPIFVFGAVFGAGYLEQVHHLAPTEAAFANGLLFLSAMVGSPVFGWISDVMKKRKLPMYIGGVISLIVMFMLMYLPLGVVGVYVMFLALGFFTSAQVITYPVIAESNVPENIATGLGMGSTLIMSGGAFLVPLFGVLLNMHWNGAMQNGAPLHTLADYQFASWMLPISFIIGIAAIIFGKETKCKRIV